MTERIGQFPAKDAMIYVDTYRNAIRKQADILKDELEVKQKRLWESKEVPPHFFAEYRALEHALLYVTKGEEPVWVTLGDAAINNEANCDPKELEACQQSLEQAAQEKHKLDEQYKTLLAKAQELQGSVVRQRQELGILRRRLEQNSSTFMVVVTTMFLVILVQLYLLWTR